MLKDPQRLKDLQLEWATVRAAQAKVSRSVAAGMSSTGTVPLDFVDFANSLLLLFGFSVLESVLQELRDQGTFACGFNTLSRLMRASKGAITWTNYDEVDKARDRRNLVAHEQTWLPRAETWKHLDAIERELISWSVVPSPAAP